MPSNHVHAKKAFPFVGSAVLTSDKLVNFKAEFFKALANPIRIKILDQLRTEELTVSEIRDRLEVELPNVSQQLAVLRAKQLVVARKQGNNIYYSCIDPTVFKLLDVAKEIFNNHQIGRAHV